MTNIITSHYNPFNPVDVDLDALTEIVWSGWACDFFPDAKEANGVYAVIDGDSADQELYNAIREMVESWEVIEDDEIGGVIYRRPGSVKLP